MTVFPAGEVADEKFHPADECNNGRARRFRRDLLNSPRNRGEVGD